jgi:hypothetical protein
MGHYICNKLISLVGPYNLIRIKSEVGKGTIAIFYIYPDVLEQDIPFSKYYGTFDVI